MSSIKGGRSGFIWKEGDWAIHRNKIARSVTFKYCLRHMCKKSEKGVGGCACGTGKCYYCKTAAPDAAVGFLALVRWER